MQLLLRGVAVVVGDGRHGAGRTVTAGGPFSGASFGVRAGACRALPYPWRSGTDPSDTSIPCRAARALPRGGRGLAGVGWRDQHRPLPPPGREDRKGPVTGVAGEEMRAHPGG